MPSLAQASASRLETLLSYLGNDPDNPRLILDAADAALEEGRPEQALDLLDRHDAVAGAQPRAANLRGLALMASGKPADAAGIFQLLMDQGNDAPGLRYNLASALAAQGEHERVVDLLDEAAVAVSQHAAILKIRAFHHLGRLEDALAAGERLASLYPDDGDLMAALATAAIDADRPELARSYAERGGNAPEAVAAVGTLALAEGRTDEALASFEAALAQRPDSARALIGKGMALLAREDPRSAAPWLDRGAERFDDHIGSWIAAGWAYFAIGDYGASRSRFERALEIDDRFAETHGGLAVLDIVAGDLESARRRTEVALRLDGRCLSGALARSMLLELGGDASGAERIRAAALATPVDASGRTIAQAIAATSGRSPPRK